MTPFRLRVLLILGFVVLAWLFSARADNVLHVYADGLFANPVPGTYTGNPSTTTVDETFRGSDGWNFAVTTPFGPSGINVYINRDDLSQTGYSGQYLKFSSVNAGETAIAVGNYPNGTYPSAALDGGGGGGSGFQVLDIAYDPVTGGVTRLAVDFSMSQTNFPGRVAYGQLRYNSDVPLDAGNTYLEFDQPAVTGSEGDGEIPVLVARRGGSAEAVSVTYQTGGGDAKPGVDYTPVSGTLSWAAGDASPKMILLPVIQNDVVDGPRTVGLTLTGDHLGATTGATVTITDDDPLPSSVLHYRYYGADAGEFTATPAAGDTFVITDSGRGTDFFVNSTIPPPTMVGFDFAMLQFARARLKVGNHTEHDGSGLDIQLGDGLGQVGPGTTNWQILQVNYGADGTLLQCAVNFDQTDKGGQPVLRGELRYHSALPLRGTVGFTSGTFQGKASAAGIPVTVERVGDVSDAASVQYATADYSALANVDYTPTRGTLSWAAGDASPRTFTVPLLHHAAAGNRVCFVNLSGQGIGDIGAADITILDDTLPPVATLPEPDGRADTNYNVLFTNSSQVILSAIQPLADGRALVGGNFAGVGSVTQPGILRLDAAGAPDFSFPSPFTLGAEPQVNAIVLQPDGKILVGGSFSLDATYNTTSVVRLNADGSLDAGFQADAQLGTYAIAYKLVLQPDGRILFAGRRGMGVALGAGLVRLNADGSLDTSFTAPNADLLIDYEFAFLQPDGKILTGDGYDSLKRLNADGSIDPTYGPVVRVSGTNAVALQPDGKLVLAAGPGGSSIVRLNPDGTNDRSFNLSAAVSSQIAGVNSIVLQPDGKLLVGFSPSQDSAVRGPIGILRLNPDGSQDASFSLVAGLPGVIGTLALEPDGGLLLSAGYSSTKNGVVHAIFARLAGVVPDTTPPTVTVATRTSPAVRTGAQAGEVTLTRTGNISGPLVVEYTVRGAAVAGTDYVALSGRKKIKPGHDTATIDITPLAASLGRGALKVKVALRAADDYTVGASRVATVKIVDSP